MYFNIPQIITETDRIDDNNFIIVLIINNDEMILFYFFNFFFFLMFTEFKINRKKLEILALKER